MAFKTISSARLTPMQNPAVRAKTTFNEPPPASRLAVPVLVFLSVPKLQLERTLGAKLCLARASLPSGWSRLLSKAGALHNKWVPQEQELGNQKKID